MFLFQCIVVPTEFGGEEEEEGITLEDIFLNIDDARSEPVEAPTFMTLKSERGEDEIL